MSGEGAIAIAIAIIPPTWAKNLIDAHIVSAGQGVRSETWNSICFQILMLQPIPKGYLGFSIAVLHISIFEGDL